MTASPPNEITVSFPASDTFSAIGRVAVTGVARRLAIDISVVEELRLTADAAVDTLLGSGRITVTTQWSDIDVVVRLENPEAELDDFSELHAAHEADDPSVEAIFEPPSRIFLRLRRLPESEDSSPADVQDEEE